MLTHLPSQSPPSKVMLANKEQSSFSRKRRCKRVQREQTARSNSKLEAFSEQEHEQLQEAPKQPHPRLQMCSEQAPKLERRPSACAQARARARARALELAQSNETSAHHHSSVNQLVSLALFLAVLAAATVASGVQLGAPTAAAHTSTTAKLGGLAQSAITATKRKLLPNSDGAQLASRVASGSKLGDWLVHSVAPVVATRIIDNVLQAPDSSKAAKPAASKSPAGTQIDTQALAEKIVDRLADGIKRRKLDKATRPDVAPSGELANLQMPSSGNGSRRGKSLVGDSVQQVVQNLLPLGSGSGVALGQRGLFGRAMEKHRQLTLGFGQHFGSLHQPARSSSSWSLSGPKEHSGYKQQYDQQQQQQQSNYFASSTDSSQLDENPVVLRAEHGHNLTTMTPPTQQQQQTVYSAQRQQLMRQKLQQQQKYVHTNRHNQQQMLAPKPWSHQNHMGNKRHQSPYSFSVNPTSDINVVQAPSSPAPPPMTTSAASTTTSSTTTTSTTTQQPSTTSGVQLPSAGYQQHHQITQLGNNKFKISNRHQFPSSSVAIAPNSWFSSNQPARFQQHQQHQPQFHGQHHARFPASQSASTTSTSTTTTTTSTTTTTTTPEPPLPTQTDYAMPPDMMPMEETANGQSSSVNSILSSVAASALETLGSSVAESVVQQQQQQQDTQADYSPSYGGGGGSNGNSTFSSHSQAAAVKAPASSTSARHSVITAEAIPTALGAPLYHLTRNLTTHSFLGPHQMASPPRRSGLGAFAPAAVNSPTAKALAKYLQKGVNNLSSTIFSRQSKGWARRLGLSSVLISGLLYSAAVLANPGAPLPTNGAEVIKALGKGLAGVGSSKKRRTFGTNLGLGPAELAASQLSELIATSGSESALAPGESSASYPAPLAASNAAALLENNVNLLYQQQPQLMAIIEQLLKQEQHAHQQRQLQLQQLQQSSLFSQRSTSAGPSGLQFTTASVAPSTLEIEDVQQTDEAESGQETRRNERRDLLQQQQRRICGQLERAPTTSQLHNNNNNKHNNIYTIQAMPTMITTQTQPHSSGQFVAPHLCNAASSQILEQPALGGRRRRSKRNNN